MKHQALLLMKFIQFACRCGKCSVLPANHKHSLADLHHCEAALESLTSNYPSLSFFLRLTVNIHPQVIESFRCSLDSFYAKKQTSRLCKYLVHAGVI